MDNLESYAAAYHAETLLAEAKARRLARDAKAGRAAGQMPGRHRLAALFGAALDVVSTPSVPAIHDYPHRA